MSNTSKKRKHGSVVIVGGGIGGMQASLDLAESGLKVHMIQKDSSIGGIMAMLDKTFPTGDCSMCMISPKMVEVGRHQNIDIHILSEVVKVEGEAGDFTVTVKQKPTYVDPEKCTGCGVCDDKCPRLVPSEFEQSLAKRKSIHSLFPQAVPNTRVIDADNCLFLKRKRCKACEKFCQAGAINFEDSEKIFEIQTGAVILSPGLKKYDPVIRQELGFGRWPNVVTSIQFERLLSASGPNMGEIKRPSDNRHPVKIAWIQCVGSRDSNNANPWCSSVCCMYATKQAVIAKEHDSTIEPTVFYMEMRAYGKDFDKYVDRAKNEYSVSYKRAMISGIHEEAGTNNLILRYTAENGSLVDEVFDMAVLSIGLEPHADAEQFAQIAGIEENRYHFAQTDHFAGPKDIPETVTQGSAVAGRAMSLLGESRGTEITVKELPDEKDISKDEPRIGVIVCHCGINIAQTVDVKKTADEAGKCEDVVHSEDLVYACAPDGQERIKELIREKNLNRVVVASCTPRTHQPLFQDTIREAGINKYLFELADIREQCSWCHMGQNENATRKAIDIVKMNIAKVRHFEPIITESVPVTPAAMIIGAGVTGLCSAISLGDQGFDVHLVEKEKQVGGLARNIHHTLDGSLVQPYLEELISRARNHEKITLHLDSEVGDTKGFVGNFNTTLKNGTSFDHGAILMATGGVEYKPDEYQYGSHEKIITQRDLENNIHEKLPGEGEHYVMIQCVGSREEPFNYCSRICCQDAVKNAIQLRENFPGTKVTILYRDIRTYGLREDYYARARELGVLFNRFEPERKPEIDSSGSMINIKTFDHILQREIELTADYVVLSTGLRPHPTTESIGEKYKITRNPDGFFLEAHVKLRPVDFPSEGLFVAGLAHAPKNLDETISQALAASGRAGALLSHDRLGVSGVIAKHNRDLCMSCLACFRMCPFESPYIDEEGKVSHNEVKCTGCGICAGICPAHAFQVNNFRDDQIIAMIDTLTADITA